MLRFPIQSYHKHVAVVEKGLLLLKRNFSNRTKVLHVLTIHCDHSHSFSWFEPQCLCWTTTDLVRDLHRYIPH